MEQGTSQWLETRKKHITATDACVIMGVSPWKTLEQLQEEKLNLREPPLPNVYMLYGNEKEQTAREAYIEYTGIPVEPKVAFRHGWLMASLDGWNEDRRKIVEIKCPGRMDHETALTNKVPAKYYPQLQHQMYVMDVRSMDYFSWRNESYVLVEVERDDEYIEKMLEREREVYKALQTGIPMSGFEEDAVKEIGTEHFEELAYSWRVHNENYQNYNEIAQMHKKSMHDIEERMKELSGYESAEGAGLTIKKVKRKGNVDYSLIPELKGVDLDKYRKEENIYWKITDNK